MERLIERNDDNKTNYVSHESASPTIDIRERQRFISDQFLQFYTERGYRLVPPEDLLPKEDQTVIFTGATITPLKRFLDGGLLSPGYFIVQKCLRTQGLDDICDLNVIPNGVNYFTMCGILASPDRKEAVSNEAYELLVNRLRIPGKNMLILASSSDRDLSEPWRDRKIMVEEDSLPESSYRWTYGIPNMYGRGINFLLRFNEYNPFREIGNIISIQDRDGRIRAYEFGFGLESLLSKMCGLKKSTEANIVSVVIPYEEGPKEKLVNALVTAVVLYHHGIEPGRGKERHILKKTIKGLSFLRRRLGISLDQIKDYSEVYERAEFVVTGDSGDKLVAGIQAYEQQLAKFIAYAENQVHAHKLRNDVGKKLLVKLGREGGNMGILPDEIDETIKNVM